MLKYRKLFSIWEKLKLRAKWISFSPFSSELWQVWESTYEFVKTAFEDIKNVEKVNSIFIIIILE